MTNIQSAADQVSTLSKRDRVRFWRVLMGTPFVERIPNRATMTVDELISCLETLSDRLHEHAEDCRRREAEMARMRGLFEGGRRLFAELLPQADQTDL